MQNRSAKIFPLLKIRFHTPSPELVVCQSDEMTRGNLDPTLLWIQKQGSYLMLLHNQMISDSTSKSAQANKVRGLAMGYSPFLLGVSSISEA